MLKPSNKLVAYLRKAEEIGISPERILDGSGVLWQDLNSLRPIEPAVSANLFGYLARRTPADFAIICGKASRLHDFGIVGLAMASAPTLREAFNYWATYSIAAVHPFTTSVREGTAEWEMLFGQQRLLTPEAQRFCIEASIAAHEATIEELTGAPADTVSIDFPFEKPASTKQYNLLRAVRINFGCQATIYRGKRDNLDRPLPHGDREVEEVYRQEFEKFLDDLRSDESLRDKVQAVIRASVGVIPASGEVAAKLGYSRRSFQRQLEREGTSYTDLVQQFRVRQAEFLLRQNSFNIKEAAFVLGFADVGSFRRAVRAWTGKSVAEWRARTVSAARRLAPTGSCSGQLANTLAPEPASHWQRELI